MDNTAIELSRSKDGNDTTNVSYDGNANSTKEKTIFNEEFGPTYSVLDDMKQMYQRRVIIISFLTLFIGAGVGAAVAVIAFTQTETTDIPTANRSYASLKDGTPTAAAASTNDSTSTTQLLSTVVSPIYDEALCPVMYEGKCYRAIQDHYVNRTKAAELCEGIGWNLANVYTTSHFYMLEGYLRTLFDYTGYISAWTGMYIIPEDLQLVLSTGENITLHRIPWHKGYPDNDPVKVDIGLDFLKIPNEGSVDTQGMWNYDPTWDGNAAICEQPEERL